MNQMTQPPAALQVASEFYRRLLAGDSTFLDLVADDVVTIQPPQLPYGGIYHGRAALGLLLAERIFPLLDAGKIQMIAPILADEARAIGSFTVPARSSGELLHILEQITLREGRIAELRVFHFDPGALR